MEQLAIGIVVRSTQLFPDSLPLASLGSGTFLDFLLNNIQQAFPNEKKIFAMGFENLQEISEKLVKSIEKRGFSVCIGDRSYLTRLLQVARSSSLNHIVDLRVDSPLTSMQAVRDMMATHTGNQNDITVCQNLPTSLAPIVVSTRALMLFDSMKRTGFSTHYQVKSAITDTDNYWSFMLVNPGYFKVGFHAHPIQWEGPIDMFTDQVTNLHLRRPDDLNRLRTLIYHANKLDITPDDVVNYILINNMRVAWDQPTAFDSKYIVADQAGWDSDEAYIEAARKEVSWFVLDDKKYLGNKYPSDLSILEVGCGHGRLLRVLCKDFKKVYGTDASTQRFLEARFRCRDISNIQVTQNDGMSLSQYTSDSMDLVFAHGVFVHINSKSIIDSYIREMTRVVKTNGRIKFDVYSGRDVYGITANQFGIGARYTPEEIKSVFDNCGLRIINIEPVNTRQFSRTGSEYSMPIEQLLVIGEKSR